MFALIRKPVFMAMAASVGCLFSVQCFACPLIEGFIDFNCDRQHKVVVTGDSIAYGRGDQVNGQRGGYVLRLNERYTESDFVNLGVPGATTKQLYRGFRKYLTREGTGTTKRKTKDADIIVISIGVNDWWDEVPAGMTVRNIKRIVKFLRTHFEEKEGTAPFIIVTTLLPNRVNGQQDFVRAVNRKLLKYRSSKLPVYVRFDKMRSKLLDETLLHPSSRGHVQLANILEKFLVNGAQTRMAEQRSDNDVDDIYDELEDLRFGTDPTLTDTDGDGYTDGQEVFELASDPLDGTDPASE